jgi:RNA polymerase sigma factor (sigma-70 family)
MQQPEGKEQIAALNLDLYDQHAPAILAYLCQHISNVHDARDLLIEVFLAAMQRPGLTQLEVVHQYAWLRRVAHNKMVDRLRRQSRLTLVSLDEVLERESDELTPEQQSMRRESYAALHQAIARLVPEQQMLLQLRYGEGLRLVEIAALLRKPDGTVRKLLKRTLQRLRTFYDQLANEREN